MAGEGLMKYSFGMIGAAMLAAFFAFATHAARGDVLVSTNFDSAPFQAGQSINGRGGFLVSPGVPSAMMITTSNAFDGGQALEAIGSQLTGSSVFYQTAATTDPNYDAIANGNPIIALEVHARLDGPSTDTGNGTADDITSVNLDALLSDNSYFSTYISSNGQAYGYVNQNYVFSGTAALGQYHDLKLVLDFNRRASTFIVDGNVLGTEPFDSTIQSSVLVNADMSLNSLIAPTQYTGTFDDFSVTANPEPAAAVIFIVAGFILVLRRTTMTRRSVCG